jgi:hypothetical protein
VVTEKKNDVKNNSRPFEEFNATMARNILSLFAILHMLFGHIA